MTFLKPIYRLFAAGALIFNLPVTVSAQIDRNSVNQNVSDRDAQPLVRIPPIMPTRADRSGHCKVRFDVSPQGMPFNIEAISCSQTLFKRPSIRSVQNWKYDPKIVNGRTVSRSGVESKISFRLLDERGKIIPETVPIAVTSSVESDSEEGCRGYSGVIEDHMHYLPTDGDATYIGNICDGEPHGQGKAMFGDGSWYEGTFDEGELKLGRGSYVSDDPEEGTYSGAFKDDEFHGYGTRIYQDEGIKYTYTGQFEDGDEHGNGELKSDTGLWFKGTFDLGDPDTGTGKIDDWGDLVEGYFVGGYLNGQGSIHYEDGSWEKGSYKDGILVEGDEYTANQDKLVADVSTPSKSFIRQPDGSTYDGMVLNGVAHGYGELKNSQGGIASGTFKNGGFVEGKIIDTNGNTKEGQFLNGKLHGQGVESTKFSIKKGQYVNGVLHGEGYYEEFGTEFTLKLEGVFENGKLISGKKEFAEEGVSESRYIGVFKGQSKYGGLYNGEYYNSFDGQQLWGEMKYGEPAGRHILERTFNDGTVRISGYLNSDGQLVTDKCTIIDTGRSCIAGSKRQSRPINNGDDVVASITAILNAIILSQ